MILDLGDFGPLFNFFSPIEAAKLGPGHYLSKDDMIRPKAPTFKIVLPEKKSLTASEILAQFDQRDYLDTDYDPIKKRTVLGVINPETDQEPRIDPDELKMVKNTHKACNKPQIGTGNLRSGVQTHRKEG